MSLVTFLEMDRNVAGKNRKRVRSRNPAKNIRPHEMNAVDFRLNGATGVSDMAGAAAKVAVERCGKQPRYNEMMRPFQIYACRAVALAKEGEKPLIE